MNKQKFIFIFIFSLNMTFSLNAQTDYPVPSKTSKSLFYIQRNHNKNTIVYDANFDENGNLNRKKPIHAYWIRFEEEGQKMELRPLEKWMVFGVSSKMIDGKNEFKINLSASDKIEMRLKQIEPFKAEIYTIIHDEKIKLDHIYAELAESGWLPKPIYAEFYGIRVSDGSAFYKKVDPQFIK